MGKNDSLNFPAGGGSPLIDASYNNVRRIDTNSQLSYTVQNGVTIKLSCDCYSKSESDTYLANKQDTISNNSSSGTELLTTNTLRRLIAGSNITLGLVNGDQAEELLNHKWIVQ